MYHHVEAFFEDHGVCSGVITRSLALGLVLHGRLPPASQLAHKQKGAHFLTDPVAAYNFPPHSTGFALHRTHVWSASDTDVIEPDDILALAAAVYMIVKLFLSPQ